jgi:hypothetical protein
MIQINKTLPEGVVVSDRVKVIDNAIELLLKKTY